MAKIQSFFYFIYRASSSTTHYFFTRVTQLGVMVLMLIPIVTVVFLTYYRLASLYLLVLLSAAFLLSLTMLIFRRAKIEVKERILPSYATAGQKFSYEVHFINSKQSPLNSALVHDVPPDSRPSRSEFVSSREPLESKRNAFDRVFAYYRWLWLCFQKMKFGSSATILPVINGGSKGSMTLACTPQGRGKLIFHNMRLIMPDPLFLLQSSKRVKSPRDEVLVLPKRYNLPELMLDGSARDQVGGQSYSSVSGVSDDFKGLRGYRSGDPIKHIDWAAWARTGKPVIREYENTFFPRYALVLDTNGSYENAECFEEAVSIAASFAKVVDTDECLLDLIFLNEGAQTLTVGKGAERSESFLERLATLEMEMEPDWDDLSAQVLRHATSISSCIVIFNQLSDERIALVKKWRSAGINLLILVLVMDSDSEKEVSEIGGQSIRVQSVQRDLLKLN